MNCDIKKSLFAAAVFMLAFYAPAEETEKTSPTSTAPTEGENTAVDRPPEVIIYNPDNKQDFSIFSDTRGNTVRLKISAYTPDRGEVSVEREDRKKVTVNIKSFSNESRELIEKWYIINQVISDRGIKVSFEDYVTERSEKMIEGSLYINGIKEDDSQNCGVDKYESIAYKISIKNNGKYLISGAHYKYCLFYGDASKEPTDTKSFLGGDQLLPVNPRKTTSIETNPIELFEEYLDINPTNDSRSIISFPSKEERIRETAAEGELLGIRFRLFLPLPDGSEVMREFTEFKSGAKADDLPWPEQKTGEVESQKESEENDPEELIIIEP